MTAAAPHLAAPPDLHDGQQWFLPSNARKPARTIHEVVPTLERVDYADSRGVRCWCLVSSFASWAVRYGAYVR